MTSFAMVARAGLSLLVVLGLMWLLARYLRGRTGGRAIGAMEVVARQGLGRSSAVAVVRVGEQALVLGVTEQQITLLGNADLAALVTPAADDAGTVSPARRPRRTRAPRGSVAIPADVVTDGGPTAAAAAALPETLAAAPRGPLTGSILSPTTWRTTVEVLREKSVRR